MAEESINTDKKPKKDRDQLTVDELEKVAGGRESSAKANNEEVNKVVKVTG